MSDKEREDEAVEEEALEAEQPETEATPDVEVEPEPELAVSPGADTPAAGKRSGSGIAAVALLLAAVAVVAAGYLVFEDWRAARSAVRAPDPLADIRSRIASSSETLTGLDAALAQLESTDTGFGNQLGELANSVDERLQLLDSLPPRMATMEQSLAALQGVSAGTRSTWLLAEAEYYMQIANAQLQLAGNPYLAALALRMADERIAQLADPALTGVRRALADELAALDGMEKPDIEGISLKLASLARVVRSLPLRELTDDKDGMAETDAELSGVDRAWASVKGAVGGLVRHSKPGAKAIPLMTPESEYFLRTNLELQLQAARLALLRGEQAVFEQSLDDTAAWLGDYFDAGNAQVLSAAETITEIRSDAVSVSTPDISGSLRLLRQFRTLAESAQ